MAKEEKNVIFRIEIIQNIAQVANHYLVNQVIYQHLILQKTYFVIILSL
ncbi:hypothetical protein [Xenorhabdus sp. TH1]